MTKIVLQDLSTLTNETAALNSINSNNAVIEAASDNSLSRDGTTPNQMGADFDMNSHRILNIGDPLDMNHAAIIGLDDAVALTEPVTLNQLNNAILSGGGAPATFSYITANTEALSQGRKLAVGTGLTKVDGGAGGSITLDRPALTGDVTASAGVNATTIAPNAVTYAKVQQVGASKVLGNPTGALANVSEIAPDTSLNFTGSTLQRSALTGDVTASAGSNATTIAASAVTNAKLANMAQATVKGRAAAAGTGAATDLTADQVAGIINTTSNGVITLPVGGAGAGEGGQFQLAKPASGGTLTSDVAIDLNTNSFRVFENGGTSRGFFADLTACSAAAGSDLFQIFGTSVAGRVPASGGGTTNFLRADGNWVAAGGGASGNMTRRTITGADTVVSGDKGNLIEATSGTFTLAFTAAATLASGFWCIIYNSGTGDVTLDPNGAELIDGLTTWVLYPGGAITVICTGTAFESILLAPMRKQFDANGTFTKPGVGTFAVIRAWGAGGGASRAVAASNNTGGGGGGYKEANLLLSALGTTETVTIGAGGTAATVNATNGVAGGNTTFGSLLTAYGGSGGVQSTSNFVGGGGMHAAGSATTGYLGSISPQGDVTGASNALIWDAILWEGGPGAGASLTTPAGKAVFGGGGGGSQANPTGGTSQFGGAGQTAAAGTPAAAAQPGGGGGSSTTAATTGSAGGAGRAIVYVY